MNNIDIEKICINIKGESKENLVKLYNYLTKHSELYRNNINTFLNTYLNYVNDGFSLQLQGVWVLKPNCTKIILTIEEFLKLDPYNTTKNVNIPMGQSTSKEDKEVKQITIFKKYELPKVKRTVTICVTIDQTIVKAGYAVLAPGDKYNKELAEKISFGRAVSDRTNMVEMQCGFGMDKKYIVYAIADDLAKQIDNGKFVIKGIKEDKESKLKGFTRYPEETVDSNLG